MQNLRFILLISLAMVTMKLWTTWETEYAAPPAMTAADGQQATGVTPPSQDEVPGLIAETTTTTPTPLPGITTGPAAETVHIVTDMFTLDIDTRGAGVVKAALNKYPVDLSSPDEPYVLMEEIPGRVFISQGGLLSRQPAPTHEMIFRASAKRFEMPAQSQTYRVPFTWTGSGMVVRKIYEFTRGSHLLTIHYEIENGSQENWSGRSYLQLKRNRPDDKGMRFIYTYTGAVLSDPDNRYRKISFDDIDDQALATDTADGWIAVIQHYFLAALLPPDITGSHHYYTRALGNDLYSVGMITPTVTIAPGGQGEIVERMYIGPKDQEVLADIATGLDLTVDYGKLWFIAKPLFWLLEWIHDHVGNWGWSIILVTVFIKLVFFRLSAAGFRSMANMRRVQPRLLALKERYKDDRVRMNQAMMQIYKEEKINPFGGCLPILIQIPVFISLYWVLLESVELRQAGFILWIHDLSTPDPYWVLPLIMGVTMFIQQKLNPAPMDPIQARVMSILPIVFTVFFGFFPSGLVLYWVVNNTLSILQQWVITRNLERAGLGTPKK